MKKMEQLNKALSEKRCVKVISGINNFDTEKVKRVVTAADQAGASAVDVAARENIIYITKELTDISVFVSSVVPEELKMAYDNGADVLEVGNFDNLYAQGMSITSREVLDITRKTLDLVGSGAMMSVTVPGHLSTAEQINLAMELETLGVHLIQTEGSAISEVVSNGARGFIEKAHVSIANTIELTRNLNIPVMTASGITVTTAPLAIAAGASAVGIGSCVNKLESTLEMIAVIRSVVESISKLRNPSKEEALV